MFRYRGIVVNRFRMISTNLLSSLLTLSNMVILGFNLPLPCARADENATQPVMTAEESALTLTSLQVFEDANWFFYVGTGIGQTTYDSSIRERIEEQKLRGGSSPQSGHFDLPAVYRKISPGLAVGGVWNLGLEHFAGNWRDNDSFAIHTYNLAASSIWFVGQKIGDGWFLRSDVGYSHILQVREKLISGEEVFEKYPSNSLFYQLALGYGLRAGETSKILLHVNAFSSSGGQNSISGASFNMGFLL
jgi:hypothetical protein